mmetsp:Transcript_27940/g.49584  ORF Transcript_27940/g.49584 Transcript_27940/m.49584 type:complete len:110 (+) Transcript_27940:1901-2230(+)
MVLASHYGKYTYTKCANRSKNTIHNARPEFFLENSTKRQTSVTPMKPSPQDASCSRKGARNRPPVMENQANNGQYRDRGRSVMMLISSSFLYLLQDLGFGLRFNIDVDR